MYRPCICRHDSGEAAMYKDYPDMNEPVLFTSARQIPLLISRSTRSSLMHTSILSAFLATAALITLAHAHGVVYRESCRC